MDDAVNWRGVIHLLSYPGSEERLLLLEQDDENDDDDDQLCYHYLCLSREMGTSVFWSLGERDLSGPFIWSNYMFNDEESIMNYVVSVCRSALSRKILQAAQPSTTPMQHRPSGRINKLDFPKIGVLHEDHRQR